jgi:hypothetical protein
METNETRKGKYSKIIKEKKLQKRRNQIKLIIMKKNLT